ncbi:MAG: helix-turn-helix domain-containing protein [Lachnospiraceae bacterium]|nr:helix-turn-helix domain-containing protein [Lachnospiraceae bacterium]
MILRIKNMVCDRCVKVVKEAVAGLGLNGATVGLGYIEMPEKLDKSSMTALETALEKEGFEILKSREEELVELTKGILIKLARADDATSRKLSVYLSETLGVDYTTLSRIFSASEGRTIERYYILQKIEYVKELIDYGGKTMSEIAHITGYSSVAHLSRQFKEVTGLTPTAYKDSGESHRQLDKI